MKNQPFYNRPRYALSGIRTGFQNESSFKVQCVFAVGALFLLLTTQPKPVWWAVVSITAAVFGVAVALIWDFVLS